MTSATKDYCVGAPSSRSAMIWPISSAAEAPASTSPVMVTEGCGGSGIERVIVVSCTKPQVLGIDTVTGKASSSSPRAGRRFVVRMSPLAQTTRKPVISMVGLLGTTRL